MRISVRLWQTLLFVAVVLVAMLIFSSTLFTALERSVREVHRSEIVKDASELALLLRPSFPPSEKSRPEIRDRVSKFVDIFEDDAWVFDARGRLVERYRTRTLPDALIKTALAQALAGETPFSYVDYQGLRVAMASQPVYDREGRRVGAVVVADQGTEPLSILNAARDQLVVTFWVALVISGLLGFVFAEIIRRQLQRLSDAANAVAQGDFDTRLKRTRVPDEIGELAGSYNRMAAQLGEAFAAIKGQERETAAVVEAMAEGVVAVDRLRVVRTANPVAARLLGVDAHRFTARPIDEVVRDESILTPIDGALQGRHVSETVTVGARTLQLHGTPVMTADGVSGAVLLIADVTELKRWEAAQRLFIANASHEMRTPIAALKGFIELLEGGAKEKPAVRDEFLGTMQAEVERLQRLVTDLFMLAQLDAGRLRLEMQPEPLEQIVGDVVAVMGPLADEAAVEIAVDLPAEKPAVVCDRDRTVQVLMGFVDNALKYCRPGDVVTVWASANGFEVDVGVRDTGEGIPPQALGKIFDRFYRAEGEKDEAGRGTGLGLAIAKEIVEAQGSSIHVRSRPGEGADFWFALRRAE